MSPANPPPPAHTTAPVAQRTREENAEPQPLSSQGWTSTIYHFPDDPTKIIKSFNVEDAPDRPSYPSDKLFHAERTAYERFSSSARRPPGILTYHGPHPDLPRSLVLEYAAHHDMERYLAAGREGGGEPPTTAQLYRWTRTAAAALEHAHALGVRNGDIHLSNVLVTAALEVKIGDWAGASVDGGPTHSSYRLPYRLIDADGRDVTRTRGVCAATEIFALGTVMYCIIAGQSDVWPEWKGREGADEEIRRRISRGEMPETEGLRVLGSVVERCWKGGFREMKEVRVAIEEEEEAAEWSGATRT